jgi:hypothetical protein
VQLWNCLVVLDSQGTAGGGHGQPPGRQTQPVSTSEIRRVKIIEKQGRVTIRNFEKQPRRKEERPNSVK